jgi:dTDP-4-dehydrorhamnose 3,5-epimerase
VIQDVTIKDLTTYTDERGFFREVVRVSDEFFSEGFGQWSHTVSYTGVAKAWHVHKRQTDWWYVAAGIVKAVLYDTRPASQTHGELFEVVLGQPESPKVLKVPPGVAHGYKVLQGPAHVFYVTSRIYDPADEGRIPYDDPTIGYDWTADPVIK